VGKEMNDEKEIDGQGQEKQKGEGFAEILKFGARFAC
jgi:hypothetical protein